MTRSGGRTSRKQKVTFLPICTGIRQQLLQQLCCNTGDPMAQKRYFQTLDQSSVARSPVSFIFIEVWDTEWGVCCSSYRVFSPHISLLCWTVFLASPHPKHPLPVEGLQTPLFHYRCQGKVRNAHYTYKSVSMPTIWFFPLQCYYTTPSFSLSVVPLEKTSSLVIFCAMLTGSLYVGGSR